MIIPNSAVRLLDDAAKIYKDKIAVSDENENLSFVQLQKIGHSIATSLLSVSDGG